MNFNILYDIDAKDLFEMRKKLGWKEIGIRQLEIGLSNTMYKISIKEGNDIVALGRLIGDYSCKGLLSDILVDPKYQGKGYGKIVVTSLINMVKENLKEGELFQIEATPPKGNLDFYIKCGLKYKPENQDGVYIWIKK